MVFERLSITPARGKKLSQVTYNQLSSQLNLNSIQHLENQTLNPPVAMTKLVAASQLESDITYNPQGSKKKGTTQKHETGQKSMFNKCYLLLCSLETHFLLGSSRLCYSHPATVSFSATVQARLTTLRSFGKIQSNAFTGNVAPTGSVRKKYQHQHE